MTNDCNIEAHNVFIDWSQRQTVWEERNPCPRCGCEYNRLQSLVLTSNPPIHCMQCPDCGWNSYYDKKKKEDE